MATQLLEIPMDMETPVSAFLKLRSKKPLFLFESVEGGERSARYSFLGLEPQASVIVRRDSIEYQTGGTLQTQLLSGANPFDLIRNFLASQAELFGVTGNDPQLPLMGGGLVGYASYDMVRFVERLPSTAREVLGYPLASFAVPGAVLVFDHRRHRMSIRCFGRPDAGRTLIPEIVSLLKHQVPRSSVMKQVSPPEPNKTKAEFMGMVVKAKDHILAGDAFQIVPSIRFDGQADGDPFQAYRALRMVNPSPYMYYLDMGFIQIAGSSPETLVRLDAGEVMVRPIAGTRSRGATPEEDRRLRESLLADEKERAEHVMLVDLARNDVGRVARPGTVTVNDFMSVENYSHVMHIVSTVTGKLNEEKHDMFDVYQAAFPAGTVSGAPKVRAMEIIEELEGERRGPYAGSVGYFGFNQSMDHAITIRTILFSDNRYSIQAGAGIVADSQPENEHQEVINKAGAMFRALELAKEL
jgi:anthranilate synthase component 1